MPCLQLINIRAPSPKQAATLTNVDSTLGWADNAVSSFFTISQIPLFKLVSIPLCTHTHSPILHCSYPSHLLPHLLPVNFHHSLWSISTPPGGQPLSLLGFNLRTAVNPHPSMAVNLHLYWESTSLHPGGQPPSLLGVNFPTSWRSILSLPPTC